MSSLFYYFFMAIGLSMDAFSLAIVYGTNGIKKKKIIALSIIVGIFHFVMPNLSGYLGKLFLLNFSTYGNIIAGVVFFILAIEMIASFKEKNNKYQLDSYLELVLFGLAVSIDSFSVGLALTLDNENIILAGIVFSLTSAIFTFCGLLLGKKLSEKVGNASKIIGILILFIFAVKYLLNVSVKSFGDF